MKPVYTQKGRDMENQELVKLIMKVSKGMMPGKGPQGGPGMPPQGGPGMPPQGGPGMPPQGRPGMPPMGAGGPPTEKKLMTLLSVAMPKQPASTLSKIMGMPGPGGFAKVCETANELAADGLVEVEEISCGEKKEVLLTITDAGKAKMEEDQKKFEHRFDSKFEDLSDGEKEQLYELLSKIKIDK